MDLSRKPPVTTTKPAPAEPAERFLRGQRRVVRSKRLGRGLFRLTAVVALTAGLAAVGAWGVAAMSRAPELTVDRVRVEGNERLSDGEILELLELTEGSNILTLDLDEIREKLLRSTWVKDVALERVLPATLTLAIEERSPVAVAVMHELYLLAEDGTVLDEVSPFSDIEALPLARGIADGGADADADVEDEQRRATAERLRLAGRVAGELERDPRLIGIVSEIDVEQGARSIAIRLRSPALTLLVGEASMTARLRESVPLIEGILERFPTLEVVDLRFEGRVYLRTSQVAPDGGASF